MPQIFEHVVTSHEESKDLSLLTIVELMDSHEAHEKGMSKFVEQQWSKLYSEISTFQITKKTNEVIHTSKTKERDAKLTIEEEERKCLTVKENDIVMSINMVMIQNIIDINAPKAKFQTTLKEIVGIKQKMRNSSKLCRRKKCKSIILMYEHTI